jgi:TonB-dependent starch-binding outer membrane protein SusC
MEAWVFFLYLVETNFTSTVMKNNTFIIALGAFVLCHTLLSAFSAYSQEFTVHGSVSDLYLKPLSGVQIQVKKDTVVSYSDSEGNFIIQASKKGKLVFSYRGYESITKSIEGQNELYVVLLQNQSVKTKEAELVNLGYGTAKKENTALSSTSVDMSSAKASSSDDIYQLLKTVPGIEFVGNNELRIRGTKSINLSNAPLIIVDGIPYSGSLSNLNTKDIKSIDVLKDASTTTAYGVRGANGVIVITLKKAKN